VSEEKTHRAKILNILDPYFGIDPASDEAGRLRAAQISAISNTTPLMLIAKVLCGFFLYLSFYNTSAGALLNYWFAAMLILAGLGFSHAYQTKKRGEIKTASTNAYRKASQAALFSGILWAMIPILLYPNISENDRVIIVAVMSGLMGGGALSLYAVPRAMFTWLVILMLGSVIALFNTWTSSSFTVLSLLVVYSVSLMRAGHTLSATLANNIIFSFKLSHQSDTIS